MSKALVISGANFSANKVTTVTFGDEIPCTGLEISPTTLALTSIGSTQQITVTLTPADTTDVVYYESTNTDVVTVSDAGLITSVGVGSATVTVTCGTQTATCAVTSTHVVDTDVAYVVENGYYSSGTELPTKDYIGRASGTRGRLYYLTQEYGNYRAFSGTANDGKYVIPIPKGTSKLTFTAPTDFRTQNRFHFVDANEKQTYVSGADGQCVKVIAYFNMGWQTTYPYEIDISSYTDINGFILSVLTNDSTIAAETVTSHCSIEFS